MKEELKLIEVDFEELGIVGLGDATTETRQDPGLQYFDAQFGRSWHQ